jgi:hypothetical protein
MENFTVIKLNLISKMLTGRQPTVLKMLKML